ncbi:MAG: glucosaminidase domain-containing protein [Acidocella sp.]|nr:glucosaminidase domain-containing protein [Acidocella sp.]
MSVSVDKPADHSPPVAAPGMKAAVQHMAGMLWYEMLSELNKSGLDAGGLGAGGSDFQSLFLWNIAQNDFGKYDAGLAAAASRQVGGEGGAAPALAAPAALEPALPLPVQQAMQITSASAIGDLAAASTDSVTARDMVRQATEFARAVWPQMRAAAQRLGVPPVAVLAQSALETGWGVAAPGHNLFGIKAADGQTGTNRATQEMQNGVMVQRSASFRDYADDSASISDYVGQIQAGFQNVLGQQSVAGFAQALQQAGYATDTNYAAKIITIANSPLMNQVMHGLAAGGIDGTMMPNENQTSKDTRMP